MKLAKRVFDLVGAMIGLLVLWPLLVVVAFLIKVSDNGPAFFRQERVGYQGKLFRIWKFRTMVENAERLGKPLTIGPDPRITRIGRLLRKYKLDELPQLINVLSGEMSFVGPRPEVHRYVALYTAEQKQVLDLIPGITDPASIKYRDESEILSQARDPEQLYIEEIMPEKIRLNVEYGQRANVLSDLAIIFRTLMKIAQ